MGVVVMAVGQVGVAVCLHLMPMRMTVFIIRRSDS
jgi:Trk K+ transport system NAD-binding subunit